MNIKVITEKQIRDLAERLEAHDEYSQSGSLERAMDQAVERACRVLAGLLEEMLESED
jgi:hypothetical protein